MLIRICCGLQSTNCAERERVFVLLYYYYFIFFDKEFLLIKKLQIFLLYSLSLYSIRIVIFLVFNVFYYLRLNICFLLKLFFINDFITNFHRYIPMWSWFYGCWREKELRNNWQILTSKEETATFLRISTEKYFYWFFHDLYYN